MDEKLKADELKTFEHNGSQAYAVNRNALKSPKLLMGLIQPAEISASKKQVIVKAEKCVRHKDGGGFTYNEN